MQVFLNSLLLNFESRRPNNSVGDRVPLSIHRYPDWSRSLLRPDRLPGCLEFAPRDGGDRIPAARPLLDD